MIMLLIASLVYFNKEGKNGREIDLQQLWCTETPYFLSNGLILF